MPMISDEDDAFTAVTSQQTTATQHSSDTRGLINSYALWLRDYRSVVGTPYSQLPGTRSAIIQNVNRTSRVGISSCMCHQSMAKHYHALLRYKFTTDLVGFQLYFTTLYKSMRTIAPTAERAIDPNGAVQEESHRLHFPKRSLTIDVFLRHCILDRAISRYCTNSTPSAVPQSMAFG